MIFDLTDSWATLCQVETNRGAIKADLSPFSGTSKASWRPLKTILSLFLFQVRREERRKRRSQPQTHKLVPRKEIFRNFQVTQHWLDLWKVLLFYGISTVKWPLRSFLESFHLIWNWKYCKANIVNYFKDLGQKQQLIGNKNCCHISKSVIKARLIFWKYLEGCCPLFHRAWNLPFKKRSDFRFTMVFQTLAF